MIFIKKQNGFTLVEIIVTINLAFLVVAFIVSFYLMVSKIFVGTTKRSEEKHVTNDFFYRLNEMLNKAEWYSFQVNDSSSQLLCDRDTVDFYEGKISGSCMMYLDNIENYEANIFFLSGDSLKISNGKAEELSMPGKIKVLASDTIQSISMKLKKERIYNCNIHNKPIAYKRFKNL